MADDYIELSGSQLQEAEEKKFKAAVRKDEDKRLVEYTPQSLLQAQTAEKYKKQTLRGRLSGLAGKVPSSEEIERTLAERRAAQGGVRGGAGGFGQRLREFRTSPEQGASREREARLSEISDPVMRERLRQVYAEQAGRARERALGRQLAQKRAKATAGYFKSLAEQSRESRRIRREEALLKYKAQQLRYAPRGSQVMPTAMETIDKTPFEQQAEDRTQPQGRDYGEFFRGTGMNIPSPTGGMERDFGAVLRGPGEGGGRDYGALFGGGGNRFDGLLAGRSRGNRFSSLLMPRSFRKRR